MEATIPVEKLGLILRIGFYSFLAVIALIFFGSILLLAGVLVSGAIGTFAAAATANAVSIRVFERRQLSDLGLNLHPGWGRNLAVGLVLGIIAACVVILGPVLAGAAFFESTPASPGSISSALFVSFILIFGAVGEELLFRGYGFQVLLPGIGRIATVALSSVLFGWAHTSNLNVSGVGIANTIGFGIALAYCFLRSGDLWLPIGLHFGWNWVLPLAGVNLSGYTMGVTGYAMRWRASDLWSGGAYGPEGSVLTSGIIAALLVCLWKAPVIPQRPPLLAVREEG
jgi:membrane protease YdiL (CAAX protease family)